MNIEELGFTKQELQERVVEKIAEEILSSRDYDEDGIESPVASEFKRHLEKLVQKEIDRRVAELGSTQVAPLVIEAIDKVVIQKTNEWGEARGVSVSFIEYLVQRAEAWIKEPVDSSGESRSEARDTYNKRFETPRIVHMIDKHIGYSVKFSVEAALKDMNSKLATGIAETVKTQITKTLEGVKVEIATPGR